MVTTKGLDISETVDGVGCGFVMEYGREELARTIREASKSGAKLQEMGRREREYFEQHLSWGSSKTALIGVYRALPGPA